MNLLRSVLIGSEVMGIIRDQRWIMERQRERIKRLELENERIRLTLLVKWRISIERPEEDVRDHLDAAIEDTYDSVARLEEHIC